MSPAFARLALTLAILAAALLWAMPGAPALAQPCTADSQCRDFGQTRGHCAGNTLVIKRTMCVGHCRTVEVSRQTCPGPCVADRCVGGPLGSSPASPSGGGSVVAGACKEICSCEGRKLTYGVGYARKASQCQRRTVDCVYGCTCDPEPRCLKRGES